MLLESLHIEDKRRVVLIKGRERDKQRIEQLQQKLQEGVRDYHWIACTHMERNYK